MAQAAEKMRRTGIILLEFLNKQCICINALAVIAYRFGTSGNLPFPPLVCDAAESW
jgi:hypothetical protein